MVVDNLLQKDFDLTTLSGIQNSSNLNVFNEPICHEYWKFLKSWFRCKSWSVHFIKKNLESISILYCLYFKKLVFVRNEKSGEKIC